MNCPNCKGTTHVKDSRGAKTNCVRRRRECDVCLYRFTTKETIISPFPKVAIPTQADTILAKLEEIEKKQTQSVQVLNKQCNAIKKKIKTAEVPVSVVRVQEAVIGKLEEVDRNQRRAAQVLMRRYATIKAHARVKTPAGKEQTLECTYCGGKAPCQECADALSGKRKPFDASVSTKRPRWSNILYGEKDK